MHKLQLTLIAVLIVISGCNSSNSLFDTSGPNQSVDRTKSDLYVTSSRLKFCAGSYEESYGVKRGLKKTKCELIPEHVYFDPVPLFTIDDIVPMACRVTEDGDHAIEFLAEKGSVEKITNSTSSNLGKLIVIVWDGRPQIAQVLMGPLENFFEITFKTAELRDDLFLKMLEAKAGIKAEDSE